MSENQAISRAKLPIILVFAVDLGPNLVLIFNFKVDLGYNLLEFRNLVMDLGPKLNLKWKFKYWFLV